MLNKNINQRINVGIVDEPNDLSKRGEDTLKIQKHANALTTYIKNTATPMTIGIQGEWGSGKTSLLNSIHYALESDQKYQQIWINAWENSLLSTPEESLLKIINEIISSMLQGDTSVKNKDNIKNTVTKLFKGGLRIGATIAAGSEGKKLAEELWGKDTNSIKILRKHLVDISTEIKEGGSNPYEKIIIYVDDLDRIDPPDAVRILELLKNIFSIPNCVFILAIDYQVVVKGLESKFGKRTEENEWEFRAFFDKIIQLPFMMPMAQYDVGYYVSDLLRQINFIDDEATYEKEIDEIINYTIGGNPRSLKRLVNSLALIEIFSNPEYYEEQDSEEILKKLEDERDQKKNKNDGEEDLLLFSLVCLQISYPNIYDILTDRPNFLTWDNDVAFNITEGKETKKENFETDFSIISKTEQFNEKWEQALYKICYINPRYRTRVMDISKLFNFINTTLLHNYKNDEDKENFIQKIIAQTVVTSVASTDDAKSHVHKPNQRLILSDPTEGLALYFENKAKSVMFENSRNVLKHIDSDIRGFFKNYSFIYSKSMGGTIYKDYENNKTSKIGAIDIQQSSSGEKMASLSLYRDPNNDFKKPLVGDLETINYYPTTNYRSVAWYKLLIPSIEKFEEYKSTIYRLVELSCDVYDLRKKDKKNRLDFNPNDEQDSNGDWPNQEFKKYVDINYIYKVE